MHYLPKHVVLFHLSNSSSLDELVPIFSRSLPKFRGDIVLANLRRLLGVMIPPTCEARERVSLGEVIGALLSKTLSGDQLTESETVDHSSAGVWSVEDEAEMDVESLKVFLGWVCSEFNPPDKAVLDFGPPLPDVDKGCKLRSSVIERPQILSSTRGEVDSNIPLTILFRPIRAAIEAHSLSRKRISTLEPWGRRSSRSSQVGGWTFPLHSTRKKS